MTHKRLAVHWDTIKTPVENFIARRKVRIEGEQQALVNKEAHGYTKWFGLVKVGPFSQEEALKRLQAEVGDMWLPNRYDSISYNGWGWIDRAERLLRACAIAYMDEQTRNGDGRVWLDDEDVRLVRGEIDG